MTQKKRILPNIHFGKIYVYFFTFQLKESWSRVCSKCPNGRFAYIRFDIPSLYTVFFGPKQNFFWLFFLPSSSFVVLINLYFLCFFPLRLVYGSCVPLLDPLTFSIYFYYYFLDILFFLNTERTTCWFSKHPRERFLFYFPPRLTWLAFLAVFWNWSKTLRIQNFGQKCNFFDNSHPQFPSNCPHIRCPKSGNYFIVFFVFFLNFGLFFRPF